MSPSLELRENREFASEIKFLVPQHVGAQILEWARGRMSPDPHATGGMNDAYQITSLYFDTEQFDVFAQNGSFGRTKYRIRRYGPSAIAFLERKLKTRGLVTKRRAAVEIDELRRLTEPEVEPGWPGFWFHQRLIARRLRPVCQIGYQRTARVSMTAYGVIRLTLDHDIEARPIQALAFDDLTSPTPMLAEQVIVEMKFRVDMPAAFKEVVERFALNAKKISKYRLAAVALGFVPEPAAEPVQPVQAVPEEPAPTAPPKTSVCLTS
jgi:SPX domain protein involved in polyphosphate accumulation